MRLPPTDALCPRPRCPLGTRDTLHYFPLCLFRFVSPSTSTQRLHSIHYNPDPVQALARHTNRSDRQSSIASRNLSQTSIWARRHHQLFVIPLCLTYSLPLLRISQPPHIVAALKTASGRHPHRHRLWSPISVRSLEIRSAYSRIRKHNSGDREF